MHGTSRVPRQGRWLGVILALILIVAGQTSTGAQTGQATPTGPACLGSPSGLLLAGPGFANGIPKPGLNVIDPATRKILRTIDMPAVLAGIPTSLPGHALIQTLDGDVYIVDATTGGAIKVNPPEGSTSSLSIVSNQFRDNAGSRWSLIGDGSLEDALLVDLQTGATTDLKTLLGDRAGSPLIVSAAVSPDDAHILIWDGVKLFVASTTDPSNLRQLGADIGSAGSFSPDGVHIVYTTTTAHSTSTPTAAGSARQTELVVENTDGSARRIVASGPNPIHARWIDDNILGVDQFVDAGGQKVGRFSTLNLSTDAETSILTYPADSAGLVTARAGRWLLHQHQEGDNRAYTWIDLKNGTLTPLPALSGLIPVNEPAARWLTFNSPTSITGVDGVAYVGLDLETGKTVTDVVQRAGDIYPPISRVSPDGRYAALQVFHGDEAQLWLLDNMVGNARQVGGPGTSNAVFSPDGCWLAITTMTGSGAARTSSVDLLNLEGGNQIAIGSGHAPIWLPTTN